MTATQRPAVRVTQIVVDCDDMDRVARFWAELLGAGIASREDAWIDLEPLAGGGPDLCFQQVPETKTVKNRVHLDLAVADVPAAGRRVTELGGVPASQLYSPDGSPWQVWRDPEGNEFCLVTAAG